MSQWYLMAFIGAAIPAWYLFQIGSRKQGTVRYKLKRTVVGMIFYWIAAVLLTRRGFSQTEAALIAVFVGFGAQWFLVKVPVRNRRIPSAVRRAVIERDLGSKGLKWDPTRHHIDHIIPFSKGGDHSLRNLEVKDKYENLSKGDKMPGVREFLPRLGRRR